MTEPSLRTCISLNNMGVSMIEKQCYRQALRTLRDATEVVRRCVNECAQDTDKSAVVGPTDTIMSGSTRQDLDERLQRAFHSLARPIITSTTVHRSIKVLSDDPTTSVVLSVAQARTTAFDSRDGKPSNTVYCPIRIEVNDVEDLEAEEICVLLLYNYGVVQLCVADTLEAATKATKLFSLAYTILFIDAGVDQRAPSPRFLLTAMVILSASVHALVTTGNLDQALNCQKHLHHVRASALQLAEAKLLAPAPDVAAAA